MFRDKFKTILLSGALWPVLVALYVYGVVILVLWLGK
jgi:hypothetical protein